MTQNVNETCVQSRLVQPAEPAARGGTTGRRCEDEWTAGRCWSRPLPAPSHYDLLLYFEDKTVPLLPLAAALVF